jgi:tetratricopeptide (TPR) repeat protein
MKLESIEKYKEIFRKDPNSQVFAALSDAYRDLGMMAEAEKVARHGVQRHPTYVSGFVSLGRILVAQENWKEAEGVLLRAATLAPENLLAYQLLGQVYIQLKRPKEALKTYKLVLFLNPQSARAKKAVEKLESLTADEYDDEVFQMKKLSEKPEASIPNSSKSAPPQNASNQDLGGLEKSLERTLSLIDAYIVRNEIAQAKALLDRGKKEFIRDSKALKKLESRWNLIAESEVFEEAVPLMPNMSREKLILERKVQKLQSLLHRIKQGPEVTSNN